MAGWDWKNDRRVQFAIGLAIVLVAAKWLFTGSLLSDIEVVRGQATEQVVDQDGNVSSVAVPSAAGIMSIAIDFIVGALVSIGAWVLNLGGLLAGKLTNQGSTTASPTVVNADDQTRKQVLALATAAQVNDLEQFESLRVQLRLPQALDELQSAYRAGDLELAASYNAELQSLISGPKPVAVSAKRKAGA